ncbi:MAG: cell division protein ZapA [Pseudomonadota bacterium]
MTILDKDYQVACPEEEVDALQTSARYLHEKMLEIRNTGKVLGPDRIAVMAALNMANELLAMRLTAGSAQAAIGEGMAKLSAQVEAALQEQKQLKF